MKTIQNKAKVALLSLITLSASYAVNAADYVLDIKGAHAFINFKTSHLGYSWLTGRFNEFDGQFSYDSAKIDQASIEVNINTASIDSNHAERDKHLKSDDFLSVKQFPNAKFVSTKITELKDNKLKIEGNFTLHGVTNPIVIDAVKVGEGKNPWGGYRAGFAGTTTINAQDYNFKSKWVGDIELELLIEGIKK